MSCIFCGIVSHALPAAIVLEDEHTVAFLDNRPLFPGHCLLIPRRHIETLVDVPEPLLLPLMSNAKLLAQAVEQGLGARGSFVGINNRISQSVPHLHIHVVPRRPKDGLKGFFWPRNSYTGDDHLRDTQAKLVDALAAIKRS